MSVEHEADGPSLQGGGEDEELSKRLDQELTARNARPGGAGEPDAISIRARGPRCYDDPAYFSRLFTRRVGMAPVRFREQQGRTVPGGWSDQVPDPDDPPMLHSPGTR